MTGKNDDKKGEKAGRDKKSIKVKIRLPKLLQISGYTLH